MKKIISIEGMHCKHCAESVKKALEELDFVKSVKIDFRKNVATVDIGKNAQDDSALRTVIEDSGFKVVDMKDKKTLF